MSRFSDVLKGKKARKNIEFPAPIDAEHPEKRDRVDLVILSGEEESDALTAARAYAERKGTRDPKGGDPHYDLGLMVHTLVRACVDSEVPGSFAFYFAPEGQAPALKTPEAFESMANVVLAHLDRERITYLYEIHRVWQEHCSPWGKADDEDSIIDKLTRLEGVVDPTVPFEMFRPATVGSLLLTTVKQRAALLRDKLAAGSSSGSSTPSNTSQSPRADA